MSQDIRICFVGDSLVNGTGDETVLGWAGRLCAMAHQHGFSPTYYNLGIRRNTSRDILQRVSHECSLRLPDPYDGRVVLSFGVNDTFVEDGIQRLSFEESLSSVREILRIVSVRYKTIFVGPPPVDDEEQNGRIKNLSLAFAREAAPFQIPFIDLFSHLVNDSGYREEVRSDGAHPRSAGYAKIARIISASPEWWFRGGEGGKPGSLL